MAGHLQDTGRAVILGDARTHGKGTVQTVMGMGPERYGSMKITTARFYRIDGRSTQVAGVSADVHLASLLDSLDIGEDKLTYALPFSRIPPADYSMSWNMHDYVPKLQELSRVRTDGDERFIRHLANVSGMKEISEREDVSLRHDDRKVQMAADRSLRELDDDDDDEDRPAKDDKKGRRRRRNEPREDDVVLDEAWRVLSDLIKLNGGAEVQEQRGWWF